MTTYRIQRGDTLSALAAKFHTSVAKLMKANPQINNASLIFAGAPLHVPAGKDEFVAAPKRRATDARPPAHPAPHHPATKPAPHHAAHGTHQTGGASDHFQSTGKGQLKGSDTSHYQSSGTFEQSIKGAQWAAIKATEGTGYTDPTFKARWAELGKKIDQGQMKLRVAYLFLSKGNGAAQGKHFLDTLGIHGKLKPGTRLALDWEASALSSPSTLRDAASYVHQVTGIWPLVYCSGSRVSQAKAAAPSCPIWKAAWSGTIAKDAPFVQYSSGPGYDHDVFNGSVADLERFSGLRT